jgi:cell division protein FtsL
MKTPVTLFLLLMSLLIETQGRDRDTILNMVISKPYFYNLVKTTEDKIYVGSSEGIMEIEGIEVRQYDIKKGYVTFNRDGKPVIDSPGIRFYKEKKFLHLLPYPEMERDEYHASLGNYFYICSGGRIYIFDIVPYEYSYPNHSIRSISKNFVGTYSGIYFKGKKLGLPVPNFTDGYIREYGNKAFICNYELSIFKNDTSLLSNIIAGTNYFSYLKKNNPLTNDIFPSPDKQHYFLATQNKLLLVDTNFTKDSVLFEHFKKDAPIVLITESPTSLIFTASEELFSYLYSSGQIESRIKLPEPILGGIFIENQLYLLTAEAFYRINSSQHLEKLVSLEKAHSVISSGGSEFIISSDLGLYLFNVASRTLSIIINGVEFNRKALYKNDGYIYAGSVNGLYKIRIDDIPSIIEMNKSGLQLVERGKEKTLIIVLTSLFLMLLVLMIFVFRKKLKVAKQTIEKLKEPKVPVEPVTKEKLESFILSNISKVSIKMIMNEFRMNAPQLYIILKPDKPGAIIQKIRLETYKKMKSEGKTNREISEVIGLSVSYLKKLKIDTD